MNEATACGLIPACWVGKDWGEMNEDTYCAECGHPASVHMNASKGYIGPCMVLMDDDGSDCICEAFEPENPF